MSTCLKNGYYITLFTPYKYLPAVSRLQQYISGNMAMLLCFGVIYEGHTV